MRRAILCLISFGTILFVLLQVVLGIREISAAVYTTKPVFQEMNSLQTKDREPENTSYVLFESITLPYTIDGTNLIVESVAAYEGPFLEDGSGSEVVNVMALLLRNAGGVGIGQAEVILQTDEQKLIFEADTIPPGATVLVLEKNRALYSKKDFMICSGWQTLEKDGWDNQEISVREVDMGTLEITNNTNRGLDRVLIYYKTWLEGIYVGGITYVCTVEMLQPGETVTVYPDHYAKGYSQVIRVDSC